eukprot:3235454-Alexandrium_andersonii.AAC.2
MLQRARAASQQKLGQHLRTNGGRVVGRCAPTASSGAQLATIAGGHRSRHGTRVLGRQRNAWA